MVKCYFEKDKELKTLKQQAAHIFTDREKTCTAQLNW